MHNNTTKRVRKELANIRGYFYPQEIPFRDMVFKCPHCCMVLFAHQKHPPRYLQNHVSKFHSDPEINDFSLGDCDPSTFR
jgi:hypothetical protein